MKTKNPLMLLSIVMVLAAHEIATNVGNMIKEELNITTTIRLEPMDFVHDGD